jgi:hypothetical protein
MTFHRNRKRARKSTSAPAADERSRRQFVITTGLNDIGIEWQPGIVGDRRRSAGSAAGIAPSRARHRDRRPQAGKRRHPRASWPGVRRPLLEMRRCSGGSAAGSPLAPRHTGINRRQASCRGRNDLANDRGTAPGLLLVRNGRAVVLRGPASGSADVRAVLALHLAPLAGIARIRRRVLCITGRTESQVDELAQPVYGPWQSEVPSIGTSILSVQGQIELHLSMRANTPAEGDARLARAQRTSGRPRRGCFL